MKNTKREKFILAAFKDARDCKDAPENQMPKYKKFKGLVQAMEEAVSKYYLDRHLSDDEPDERALDEFFDDYDLWVAEKDCHEDANKMLKKIGKEELDEPICNAMIDGLFGYFDGERTYDGINFFKGMRDGLGDGPFIDVEDIGTKGGKA